MADQMYMVIGTGPNGEEQRGEPRPRDEALRIFDAVIRARQEVFGPHEQVRVKVVAVGR